MNPEAMQAMRRVVMAVPTRIDMHLADSVVTVAYSADPEPYVLFFGKEAKRELGTGLLLKARADWKTDRIVVTRTIDGGGSLKESLVPSVDGQRLTVIVEMGRGAGQTVTFRRVYERGKPEAP